MTPEEIASREIKPERFAIKREIYSEGRIIESWIVRAIRESQKPDLYRVEISPALHAEWQLKGRSLPWELADALVRDWADFLGSGGENQ